MLALNGTLRSPLHGASFARCGSRLAPWLGAGLARLGFGCWHEPSPCCTVVVTACAEYARTGKGKSERPARERIGPAFSETAIQQNTREWGGGKAKGRPESDQPYLPAYCPCYRVGSIAGLVVCTIASTPSLVTVPDLVAARVRGATDLDRACHTNPKESGGPLTAADEQERAMLRARVDETVKALTCPPGYGVIEARKDRHRLEDFFYKRLTIRRRGGNLTDAEDAEEAQLTARVAAFKQTPEGRGRARIFELERPGRVALAPLNNWNLRFYGGSIPSCRLIPITHSPSSAPKLDEPEHDQHARRRSPAHALKNYGQGRTSAEQSEVDALRAQ
jgi:hypothetical protein